MNQVIEYALDKLFSSQVFRRVYICSKELHATSTTINFTRL